MAQTWTDTPTLKQIKIGDNVTITTKCIILAHDASMKKDLGYTKIGSVKIGNNVFIGAGSIILPGTSIGDNCVVGAGSVVRGNLEADSVYVGSPAKKICTKQEFLDKHKKQLKTKENVFDESFTLRGKISLEKKKEMKEKLESKNGYVE